MATISSLQIGGVTYDIYAKSAEQAPVGSHELSSHNHFSTYFNGTSANTALTAKTALSADYAKSASQGFGILATATSTAVTAANTTIGTVVNPKLVFSNSGQNQKGFIIWSDYNAANAWSGDASAYFGGAAISDGFVLTSDQGNSITLAKNLSATNFKATKISATNISGNLTGWATSANNAQKLLQTSIGFSRTTAQGGDGKKWCRIASKEITNFTTASVWGSCEAELNIYTKSYGDDHLVDRGKVILYCSWGHASASTPTYSMKTNGTRGARWLYWKPQQTSTSVSADSAVSAYAPFNGLKKVDIKIVATDTSVEWWLYNDVWDTTILYTNYFSDNITLYGKNSAKTLGDFKTYIEDNRSQWDDVQGDGSYINYALSAKAAPVASHTISSHSDSANFFSGNSARSACSATSAKNAGTATSAGTAANVNASQWNADSARYILFGVNKASTTVGYDSDFTYNPSSNKLLVKNISSTNITATTFSGNLSGKASDSDKLAGSAANTYIQSGNSNAPITAVSAKAAPVASHQFSSHTNFSTYFNGTSANSALTSKSALSAGYATSAGAAPVASHQFSSHTNFSTYFNGTSANSALTSKSALSAGSAKNAATASYATSAGAAPVASHQFSSHTNFSTYFNGTSANTALTAKYAVSAGAAPFIAHDHNYKLSGNGTAVNVSAGVNFKPSGSNIKFYVSGNDIYISANDTTGTDTKVTQSSSTENSALPFILKRTTTGNETNTVKYSTAATYNPSTREFKIVASNGEDSVSITPTHLSCTYGELSQPCTAYLSDIIELTAIKNFGSISAKSGTTSKGSWTPANKSDKFTFIAGANVDFVSGANTLTISAKDSTGTDANVAQKATSVNSNFPVLLKWSANSTDQTANVKYDGDLTFNASANILYNSGSSATIVNGDNNTITVDKQRFNFINGITNTVSTATNTRITSGVGIFGSNNTAMGLKNGAIIGTNIKVTGNNTAGYNISNILFLGDNNAIENLNQYENAKLIISQGKTWEGSLHGTDVFAIKGGGSVWTNVLKRNTEDVFDCNGHNDIIYNYAPMYKMPVASPTQDQTYHYNLNYGINDNYLVVSHDGFLVPTDITITKTTDTVLGKDAAARMVLINLIAGNGTQGSIVIGQDAPGYLNVGTSNTAVVRIGDNHADVKIGYANANSYGVVDIGNIGNGNSNLRVYGNQTVSAITALTAYIPNFSSVNFTSTNISGTTFYGGTFSGNLSGSAASALTAKTALSAGIATKTQITDHTANNAEYAPIWTNPTNSALYTTSSKYKFNPAAGRLYVSNIVKVGGCSMTWNASTSALDFNF